MSEGLIVIYDDLGFTLYLAHSSFSMKHRSGIEPRQISPIISAAEIGVELDGTVTADCNITVICLAGSRYFYICDSIFIFVWGNRLIVSEAAVKDGSRISFYPASVGAARKNDCFCALPSRAHKIAFSLLLKLRVVSPLISLLLPPAKNFTSASLMNI